jgi:hypothetical protein
MKKLIISTMLIGSITAILISAVYTPVVGSRSFIPVSYAVIVEPVNTDTSQVLLETPTTPIEPSLVVTTELPPTADTDPLPVNDDYVNDPSLSPIENVQKLVEWHNLHGRNAIVCPGNRFNICFKS